MADYDNKIVLYVFQEFLSGFNSWEGVSELLEDRNHLFIHQDFLKAPVKLRC